jgi:transcriptional regulator with XRE-family HTH domain
MTVGDLRGYTGLTASQIGRLFGVSRRSVNNWMAGGPMAPRHAERLSAIQQVVLSMTGKTADDRRAELLASSAGPSLFQQLVSEVSEDAMLREGPLSAKDQF